jgi:hypothetical protein
MPYYEQVLAIKKETGSKAEYASYLNNIGRKYWMTGESQVWIGSPFRPFEVLSQETAVRASSPQLGRTL